VDYNEDPEEGCLRELQEECGLKGTGIELVTVAGDPKRDPRKHVISLVYHVLIDETSGEAKAGDDAASAKWYDLLDVWTKKEMAFDHKDILKTFIQKKYP
jgi:8-oxo-dGTP diphosphatase